MNAMDAKVLRRAAELVEQGHCQGELLLVDGRRSSFSSVMHPRATHWCVRGALLKARAEITGLPEEDGDAWSALAKLERRYVLPVIDAPVVAWNNTPGRTGEEVADVLRFAADRCETP